ncbi:MAG TPA: MCE family protein, partial [Desulfobulbus sp.]|nr:MCE family protein [Desulfobulbus sp.]
MSKQGNPTLIGSFVIGAIGITVFALLTVGNLTFTEKTSRCVLYFQGSLHGLNIGAPVTYRGVTIGKVGKIAIDFNQEKNRYTIPVYIDIQEQTGSGTTHY